MKNKFKNIDFTTGSIVKNLIWFAIPMLIGSIFQLLYNMVDSAVLGRFVSMEALAAVGATATVNMVVMMTTNAVTNAMSIQMSQAWGSRDEAKMRRLLAQCFLLSLAVGLFIMILMRSVAYGLLKLLDTPEDIIDNSALYVRITCGFFIGQLFCNMSMSVLRAIGDSKAPLIILIICSLMNIALDLLFVVRFNMNVRGVALATVISQTISAILCIAYMFLKYPFLRFNAQDLTPDGTVLRDYARIALPMAFQGLLLSVGDMTIAAIVNSFGTNTVAAYTVGTKCMQIVQLSFSQVAFSMSVYTGQNFGAKQYDRITAGVRKALGLLGILVAASMLVIFIFGDRLMLIYLDPETAGDVVPGLVRQYLNVTNCFLPFLCLIWVYNSALRGIGRIRPTVISSFAELGSKIGLSLLFSHLFGTLGLWFAMPLGWVLGLIPSVYAYHFGSWKKDALASLSET